MRIFIFAFFALVSNFVSRDAEAGEVAVLQFDGYGVSFDDASLVSEGVRAAFLEVGDYFPVEAWDVSERIASSSNPDLTAARSEYAEGVTQFRAGRFQAAIAKFEASIDSHNRCGSHYARREQLADVYFHLGRSQVRIGQSTSASRSFEQVARLYPEYLETRHRSGADSLTSSVISAMNSASSQVAASPRTLPTEEDLQELASNINVDSVVVGYITSEGQIFVQMISNGRIVGDVNEVSSDVPPFPGDPLFISIVETLLQGGEHRPEPAPVESSTRFTSNPFGASDANTEAPSFLDPAPSNRPPERCVEVWWQVWKSCETVGPVTYAAKPITEQWWFWTATGVVVVGGGYYAWSQWAPEPSDPDDVIVDGNSYTLNVDIP